MVDAEQKLLQTSLYVTFGVWQISRLGIVTRRGVDDGGTV